VKQVDLERVLRKQPPDGYKLAVGVRFRDAHGAFSDRRVGGAMELVYPAPDDGRRQLLSLIGQLPTDIGQWIKAYPARRLQNWLARQIIR